MQFPAPMLGSQLPVTKAPEDPMPPSGLCGYYSQVHKPTHTQKNLFLNLKKKVVFTWEAAQDCINEKGTLIPGKTDYAASTLETEVLCKRSKLPKQQLMSKDC